MAGPSLPSLASQTLSGKERVWRISLELLVQLVGLSISDVYVNQVGVNC